jgi:hypothetical protein
MLGTTIEEIDRMRLYHIHFFNVYVSTNGQSLEFIRREISQRSNRPVPYAQ